jgi:hypothetical protein
MLFQSSKECKQYLLLEQGKGGENTGPCLMHCQDSHECELNLPAVQVKQPVPVSTTLNSGNVSNTGMSFRNADRALNL